MNTLIFFLFGTALVLGIGGIVLTFIPADEPECVTGRVELALDGVAIVIGEAVVCGEFHSNIYGPTVAAWDGDILFYHDHEE